jgi:hypothetical protein
MKMNIDFKGKKFAITSKYIYLLVVATSNDVDDSIGFWKDRECDDWPKADFILHINPDYKESEMNSNKLADEIMAKSKESVYTQEMKDKDLVPTEGMKFTYRKRDEEYTVLGVCESQNGKSTIITFEDFRNSIDCIYYSDDVLPIDQRTDIQKAVDDLVLQINRVQYDANMSDMALKDIIAVAFEAGISFTGDKK